VESPSLDNFARAAVRSGLFTNQELRVLRQETPAGAGADSRAFADHLVQIGKLSRFQASKLLDGVTLGLVLGPYHVLAPIGKGGMGSVFLARDSRTQGLVALKVLPPKRAKAQERLLIRFRREMEISQRVGHPHLTRTLEAGVHQGVNYIAMEYIPGKTLHKVIGEQGPLKVPRAARMFAEVALGLEYAHKQGLIHRDLKPSNIMVMPDDHVKVMDLGLALIQGENEAERTVAPGQGYIVGTLDYIPPEQAEDALKVDARSDIYSLGCTLYYALTGSPPFSGGNALQKMLRHRLDAPKPVCDINPAVPATFAVVLTRMIAKKPELRYQSAGELRDALLPWTGDVPGVPMAVRPVPGEGVPVAAQPLPAPSLAPPAAAAPPATDDSAPATLVIKRKGAAPSLAPAAPLLIPSEPVPLAMPVALAPSATPVGKPVPRPAAAPGTAPSSTPPPGLPAWWSPPGAPPKQETPPPAPLKPDTAKLPATPPKQETPSPAPKPPAAPPKPAAAPPKQEVPPPAPKQELARPAAEEVAPAPEPVPDALASADAAGDELPFLFDWAIPVGGGMMFLVLVWALVLSLL